jgi:RNA polymerase sigma factor (TIGR02999 family)
MPADAALVTQLLNRVRKGDSDAANELFPLVYADLRSLALRHFRNQRSGHTLQPTALIHEVYLRLFRPTGEYQDRVHFFAVAATAMRQILVNHARARAAKKRGDGRSALTLTVDPRAREGSGFDPIELDDALNRLNELDQRKARIVELRFFGGLSVEEIVELLGISKSTVEADWRLARAWLAKMLSEDPSP